MDSLLFAASAVLIVTGFFLYFWIASKYKIVDLPNHRTMHKGATIRGGGIVILLAMLAYMLLFDNPGYFFITGLALVGLLGFADDLYDLPGRVRLPIQFISITLILIELSWSNDMALIWLLAVAVVATGALNAYNFMDGINGMTGGYSLVTIISLMVVNIAVYPFIPHELLSFFALCVLIFNFFNFRKKALCFAGDVGSFTIAYILVFCIFKLVQSSSQPAFILFFTVYGIDTVFTIVERLAKRQNIFNAHRMHLFQVVVSKTGMPHLRMSGIYMAIQIVINSIVIIIVHYPWQTQLIVAATMLAVLAVAYIALKNSMNKIAIHV